jgi:mono/diheme cytochrome c family protein
MKIFPILAGLALLGSPAWAQEPKELLQEGRQVFEETCAACHRGSGEGLPGTFPALKGNAFVTGDPTPVVATVLNGRQGQMGKMPSWRDTLNDQQVAAVVSYIRQAWSNKAAPVTAALAGKIRGK